MAKTELTAQRLRELLHYDAETGQLSWLDPRKRALSRHGFAGYVIKGRYRGINIDRSRYFVHRLAWLYVHGEWPAGEIDHINGDPSDNRLANLRDVAHQTNGENQRVGRRGGLLGTAFHKHNGRWRALICVNYKTTTLGYFDTAEEAHARYLQAKREMHAGNTL
jgi:hypothetical protein